MEPWIAVVIAVATFVLGAGATVGIFFAIPSFRKKAAGKEADKIIKDAERQGQGIVAKSRLYAKEITLEAKRSADKLIADARVKASEVKGESVAREQEIKRREQSLEAREKSLDSRKEALEARIEAYDRKTQELEEKISGIIEELEKVAGLSVKEAREEIMKRVEEKMAAEIAAYIKNREDEAEEEAEGKAKQLLAEATERYAQEFTVERTTAAIPLPSDDLKGRIIGREGRNIKVIESTLGVDLEVDDTPETISISCFNPIRREIARRTLLALVKDGRIQPSRIEELAAKYEKEVNEETFKAGEEAVRRLGLPRLPRDILSYLGKLKYRTSYGQNVLEHSVEVARLTGAMAAELGLDQTLAKRAGLLHDIGKAIDTEVEGSHVQLGADLARRCNEPEIVVNAIEAHHGDVEKRSIIAHLVVAADTLSAARPGVRNESIDTYVQRVAQLEEAARSFDGVQQAYAVSAGREVRVMVVPEKVSDSQATVLAQQIKDKIQAEVKYPGTVKVSVIREYRAVETAK